MFRAGTGDRSAGIWRAVERGGTGCPTPGARLMLNGLLQTVGAGFVAAGQPRKIIAAQVAWLTLLVPALYVTAQISHRRRGLRHVLGMLVFGGVKLVLASLPWASAAFSWVARQRLVAGNRCHGAGTGSDSFG